MSKLTHIDDRGALRMVDVTGKSVTHREATVRGEIRMRPETVQLIRDEKVPKGNVLEAARLAGVLAAKRTGELIPLCHPLNLTGVDIDFEIREDRIEVEVVARIAAQTGVEMEALIAASVALLTIYDMCKAADRAMVISEIRLMRKSGGRSGTYVRSEEE